MEIVIDYAKWVHQPEPKTEIPCRIFCNIIILAVVLHLLQEHDVRDNNIKMVDTYFECEADETVAILTRKKSGGYKVEIDLPIECDGNEEFSNKEKAT